MDSHLGSLAPEPTLLIASSNRLRMTLAYTCAFFSVPNIYSHETALASWSSCLEVGEGSASWQVQRVHSAWMFGTKSRFDPGLNIQTSVPTSHDLSNIFFP